jgi:hypothetical protein
LLRPSNFWEIIRVVVPEVLHRPAIAALVSGFLQRVLGSVRNSLSIQRARGHLRADFDLDMATHALVGSVVTLVIRRSVLREQEVLKYTHEELARNIVSTVLQGFQTCCFSETP